MKIGIMSMQRVANYGSFLQAYGLMRMIESLGHEVVFVDYHPERPAKMLTDTKSYMIAKTRSCVMDVASELIDLLFFATEEQKYSLQFKKRYRHEFLKKLRIPLKKRYNTPVDTLVIGSDEVFNCLQTNPEVGYARELFGRNNHAKKLITYAASCGNTTVEGLEQAGISEEVAELLKKFDHFSVRDNNTAKVVSQLSGKSVTKNLDPVLMYDFSKEIVEPESVGEKYMVVYAYRNRLKQEEKEAIRKFAQLKNLKLYSIGGYQGFCDKCIQGSPFEILGYIKNADFVVSDTFHGTIFSVINHRQFATFIRNGHGKKYGNYEKLMDLLETLQLTSRAVFDLEKLEDTLTEEIDYAPVEHIIAQNRHRTMTYLKESI